MVLRRVSQLRGCGVFRDFTWPTDLPEFRKYNLIYGWNGSGKTTLSRLLRALELRNVPTLGQATVRTDVHDLASSDFPQATLPIRVFNRDLVNESIFPIGGGDVPPIFIVGKDNVEKQKKADRLKQESIEANAEWHSARSRHQEAERALDRYCQDRAKVIKDTLRSSGQNPFNNYNKSDFRNRASQMAKNDDVVSHCLNDSAREALLVQHKGTPKAKLAEITYRLPDLQMLADVTYTLMNKTVVSAAIEALKDDPEVADWTRRGLGLHKDRNAEKCIFCEQPLPEGRLAALEAHFSAEYERFMRELDEQIEKLDAIRIQALELKLPSRAEFYDDITAEYEIAADALRKAVDAVADFMKSLSDVLGKKQAKAFEALPMELSVPEIDADVVEAVNAVVRKHNQTSEEFETRVSSARERLAMDLIAGDIDEFKRLKDAVEKASGDSKVAKDGSDRLAIKIKEIEDEIIEHRQPAEDLNNDLRQYLGHCELRLTVKDTGYTITRNGEPAKMLSEGEMTGIALLYFLKSLEGRDFDLANGLVVFDDPVSSLDQNAMFNAFGLIRDRVNSAMQIIILTHNFTFFRLVRDWFKNLRGNEKRAWNIFMLECATDAEGRYSVLRSIDRLLIDHNSEYHYLFYLLYEIAEGSPAESLAAYYHAPSIARRVLETFLAFHFPDQVGRGHLWSQMKRVQFDEFRRSRIYRFLQTHSHRDAIGDADEDMTLLTESRSVLKDIIEFLKAADDKHVTRIISRIAGQDDSGGR